MGESIIAVIGVTVILVIFLIACYLDDIYLKAERE